MQMKVQILSKTLLAVNMTVTHYTSSLNGISLQNPSITDKM